MDAALRLSSGGAMPLLGLGTWQGEGDEVKKAVIRALELGYRHIDTAYVYRNEAQVGEGIKEAIQRGIVTRDDVFVVTKLPHNGHRTDKVKHFLKLSLKRLGLDYVDLYLIHWPVSSKYVDDDIVMPKDENGKALLDPDVDLLDTWKGMEECVTAGLTKSIGLSNYNSIQIKRIHDNAKIKPSNLQVECHLYMQQEQLFRFCSDLDIVVTAYAPLGSPGLPEFTKKFYNVDKPQTKVVLNDPVLKEISEKYHKTPAQVALRFLLQRGIIVIPKSTTGERIHENAQVFDFALSEDDFARLKALDSKTRFFGLDFCEDFENSPKYPYKEPF